MKHLLSIFITFFTLNLLSQSVGIGTTIPDTTAILDLSSTNKGLLIPRMDSISRTLIAAPSQGLMVYQMNGNKGFYYHNGTAWQKIGGDGNEWTKNGANEIYTTKTIGIGNSNPDDYAMLDITSTEKGILIPRMTETQRNAILNPDGGLLIYQTGINKGLYHFDGGDDTWKKVGDGPFSWTDGTGIVYTNNRVGIGNTNPNNSALLDLTSTNKGFLLPRMTTAQRDAITAPAQGLKIFNTDDRCEDTYNGQKWAKNCDMEQNGNATLPADNWRSIADFIETRLFSFCFVIGEKIYVGGGKRITNDSTIRKDFWEYDQSTNIWTRKADYGGGYRYGAVGFAVGLKGYVGTGNDGMANKKDFWEYDPSTNIWIQKSDFTGTARRNATGFVINNKIYLGTGDDGSTKKDFWEYNPLINTWTQKTDFPFPRSGAKGFNIGNTGYICTTDEFNELDIWLYSGSWIRQLNSYYGNGNPSFAFSILGFGYIGIGGKLYQYEDYSSQMIEKPYLGIDFSNVFACSIGSKGFIGTGNEKNVWVYNTESVNGKEYSENIPNNAVFYKGHDWTSEGNKLFTTRPDSETTIRGNFNVAKDKKVLIGTFNSNPPTNSATLHITKSTDLGSISDNGAFCIGEYSTQSLSRSLAFGGKAIQARYGDGAGDFLIQPYGGKIGINESHPDALLHLKGIDATNNRHIRLESNGSSDNTSIYAGQNFTIENSSEFGDFIFRNGFTDINVFRVSPLGRVAIGNTGLDTNYLKVYNGVSTGRYTQTGWIHNSDKNLKTNITTLSNSLSKILQLRGVSFNWKGNPTSNNQIGFIAQEVEPLFPEAVSKDENGLYSMAYQNLVAPLVEAIKEQQIMIEELKMKNEELKAKSENDYNALKAELDSIKQLLSSQSITKK